MTSKKTASLKKDYHIFPIEDGWEVRREGNKNATLVVDWKKYAVEAACNLARKFRVGVVIHNRTNANTKTLSASAIFNPLK